MEFLVGALCIQLPMSTMSSILTLNINGIVDFYPIFLYRISSFSKL